MNYNEWWHGFDLAKIMKASAIRIEDRDRDGAHTVVQFYRDEDGTWEYQDYETPYGGRGWTGEVVRGGDGLSDESVLNRLNGFADAYHFLYRE